MDLLDMLIKGFTGTFEFLPRPGYDRATRALCLHERVRQKLYLTAVRAG